VIFSPAMVRADSGAAAEDLADPADLEAVLK
jgi:hypothetical protein